VSWRSSIAAWLDDRPRYAAPVEDRNLGQTAATEFTLGSSAWEAWFGNPGIAGLPVVTERTALTVSAIFACVNLIAGVISAMTSPIYRRLADDEREMIHGDPLWWILNEEFSPRWNAANGWEYLVMGLLFHGDGIAIIDRKAGLNLGAIAGLEPVHPVSVSVLPTPDRRRLVYAIQREWGALEVYDQDDIVHVAGFGFNGYRGLSPLRNHLRMTGSVALATQEYAARFFANGARPDVVLKSEQSITPEQATEIRDRWAEQHSGIGNAHRPAVLGKGFSADPLSLPLEDAQLLETRRFSVEEIARIYGVPPFMIGQTDKTTSWGSGVETMGQGFVRFTLRQHLTKIEKELNRKFFRTAGKFIEFDTFELEKASMETLFAAYGQSIGGAGRPGFMTAEEIRNRLNLTREPKYGALHSGEGTPPPAGQGASTVESTKKKDKAA
jgi:HK97 family phage portal protein